MAVTDQTASLSDERLEQIQRELVELKLDGWLLYDFRGTNPVAGGVISLPALTRRVFVHIPARGRPVALTHRIEQQPWREWRWENRPYLDWRSLERELQAILGAGGTVAMEYSEGDAVPYLDRVPAGVLDMVRAAGARVASSGDLVSAFYSRWSAEGEASHRRAAAIVQRTAREAFELIGERVGGGGTVGEWEVRAWILERLSAQGLGVGADSVVAANAHAANPHYAPSAAEHAMLRAGDLILIDLWGKEDAAAVYADQTWMGFIGGSVPERIQHLWRAVRDARDAAVEFLRRRADAGETIRGFEVDVACRSVIEERGYGEAFIHRTGHSIDRELHGSGPNIDNLETRDTRRLIEGVGFSIEPGIYLAGDVGLRSEIDVFMSPAGPEVTTPEPQRDIILVKT
jgi:Xaa-Pro dipeptidase